MTTTVIVVETGIVIADKVTVIENCSVDYYYVDATNGDDDNDGSFSYPWKTIEKVNAIAVACRVLFKCGETWTGTTITVPVDGLYLGAYGAGAPPIIDGNDTVDCIDSNGKDNLTVANLVCDNGLDFGITLTNGSHGCEFYSVECKGCGNDGFLFSDCNDCRIWGGSFHDTYVRVADTRHIAGIEIKDGSHDILISGAECYGNAGDTTPTYGSGIAIHNHVTPTIMPYNITISSCNIHDEGLNCNGIRIKNQADVAMTDRNILVEDCTLHANTLTAISITITAGFSNYVTGVTVRGCVFTENVADAIYVAGDTINVYQNLICSAYVGTQCNINVSVGVNWWNNTHYSTASDNATVQTLNLSGARLANISIKNNIFFQTNPLCKMLMHATGAGTTGVDINYNLYSYTSTGSRWAWQGTNRTWTTWKSSSGQDANSPTPADPAFVTPGSDFALQDGSPAINAGVDVGLPYLDTAPDCGAYEHV